MTEIMPIPDLYMEATGFCEMAMKQRAQNVNARKGKHAIIQLTQDERFHHRVTNMIYTL
jgi:hypothetical protein